MYQIQICKNVDKIIPEQITFSTKIFDDYSILESVQDKADFLYTMICTKYSDVKIYEMLNKIKQGLETKGISCVFNTPNILFNTVCDVCDVLCDTNVSKFLNACENIDVLWYYLFSSKSIVVIGQ